MSELKLGQIIEGEAHRDAVHIAVAPVIAAEWLHPAERIGFIDDGHERVDLADDEVRKNGIVALGIVDPFLPEAAEPGQRFYMWLFPNTITSLRHEWTHPAFVPKVARPTASVATPSTNWRTKVVLEICQKMREDQDYQALPVLADALEEAGYTNWDILKECREKTFSYRQEFKAIRLLAMIESEEGEAAVRWVDQFAESIDQTFNRLMEAAQSWVFSGDPIYDNSENYKRANLDQWLIFWRHHDTITKSTTARENQQVFFTCSC